MNKSLTLIILFLIIIFNLKAQSNFERQAIFEAVKIGTFEDIKNKVKTSKDANLKDDDGIPLLMWAIYNRDLNEVKFLVDKGAKPNAKGALPIDNQGSYYGNSISVAVGENKIDILKYLIETCKIPVDDKEFDPETQKEEGWTGLQWACNKGYTDIARYLIEKGADVNISASLNTLIQAIDKQNLDLVKLLLENKVNVNHLTDSKLFALYYATFYDNLDIVKLLLEKGADTNFILPNGQNCFSVALEKGYLDLALLLLEKSKNHNLPYKDSSFPIHLASKNGFYKIVKGLIAKGVDINAQTKDFLLTPLMYAAYNNQLNIAKFLIKNGADKNLKDKDGKIALDYAKMRLDNEGKPMLVEMIAYLDKGKFQALTEWQDYNQEMVKFYNASQHAKAVEVAQKALKYVVKTHGENTQEEAQALVNLAKLQQRNNQYPESIKNLEKAQAIYEKVSQRTSHNYTDLLQSLADAYYYTSQYQKAKKLREEIIQLLDKKADTFITAHISLGAVNYQLNFYEEAEQNYKKVLALSKKNSKTQATAYNALGNIYQNLSLYSKAKDMYAKSLNIHSLLGKNKDKSYIISSHISTVVNYANLFYAMSEYQLAEYLYNLAIKDIFKSGLQQNNTTYANALSSLASMYLDLGRYEESLAKFKEAIRKKEEIYGVNHPSYATTLGNMTDLFTTLGIYEKSELLYKKILKIREKHLGKSHATYALTLNNLAQVYSRTKKYEKAEKLYEEALSLEAQNRGKKTIQYAIYLLNLAYIYSFNKNYEEALKLFEECRQIRLKRLGEEHLDYGSILYSLANLNFKMGKNDVAEKYYLEANANRVNIIKESGFYMSEKERTAFFNTLQGEQENFKYFAVKRAKENPKIINNFYNLHLNTKGLFLENARQIKTSIYNTKDTLLINRYENWIRQKEELAKLYKVSKAELSLKKTSIADIQKNINESEKKLSFFIKKTQLRDWQDLQKTLKSKEAIVDFIKTYHYSKEKGQEVIYAVVIIKKNTKKYPELVILDNGKDLEGKFFKYYRNAIKYKKQDKLSYEKYWSKIAEKLENIDKVYISPSGVYNKISLASLQNPQTKKYLIDEITIQTIGNARELLTPNNIESSSNKIILFGYPIYDLKEEEHLKVVKNYERGIIEEEKLIKADITASLSRDIETSQSVQAVALTTLPGTEEEVNNIDEIARKNGFETEKYLAQNALEEVLKQVKSPKILHVATHGFFLENINKSSSEERLLGIETKALKENPLLRSGLILTGATKYLGKTTLNTQVEDGILTAYEASNLNLEGTDLVILSACETGLGEVKNGEGVYGLQRAFQVAGAKTILMSLWQVDDEATKKLMTLFYKNYFKKKQDKKTAFKNAQNELKKEFAHPYYWGAFVMVGE